MSCSYESKNIESLLKTKVRNLFMIVMLIIVASWSSHYAQNERIEALETKILQLEQSDK